MSNGEVLDVEEIMEGTYTFNRYVGVTPINGRNGLREGR